MLTLSTFEQVGGQNDRDFWATGRQSYTDSTYFLRAVANYSYTPEMM